MKVNEMRFLVVDPHGVRRESRVAILLVAISPRRAKFSIQNFKKFQDDLNFGKRFSKRFSNFSTRINDDSGHLGMIFQSEQFYLSKSFFKSLSVSYD